jgi:hypothetical protein
MKTELLEFVYSVAELAAIKSALGKPKAWQQDEVKALRISIKEFHLNLTQNTCCYCQNNLHGEFQMIIDVEHILPSSKFKDLTFEIWNLSASCKRCNMWMKNEDTDFIVKSESNFFDSKYYRFIHPNFDNINKHMMKFVHQEGGTRLIKYIFSTSDKAAYAYEYFHLKDLEVDTFDNAQGANIVTNELSDNYAWIKQRVQQLEKRFGDV